MSWDWEKLKEQQRKMGGMGGGPRPPQMDDIIKKFKNFRIPGGPIVIVIIVIAILASSSFYTVNIDEVGIVQRFGKYVRTTQPGLNFKLPVGIEKVTKVRVRHVFMEEFGAPTIPGVTRARFASDSDETTETLMLTGDLNVAVVPWIVQYRIDEPFNFLFKVKDVRRLLTDMSEATMRLVIGDRSISEVISKRSEIASQAQRLLQRELDNAESGIFIVTIEMKRTNVPRAVQPSFNEVNQATQEKERLIYEAREEYNKAIPSARGEAERVVRSAEGYALDRINRAQGDAARFRAVYREYAKAQDVTMRRIYLETLGDLLPKLGPKYIIDADQTNLLPLLNLGKDNVFSK
jgi:membrane protease subunit HflK